MLNFIKSFLIMLFIIGFDLLAFYVFYWCFGPEVKLWWVFCYCIFISGVNFNVSKSVRILKD